MKDQLKRHPIIEIESGFEGGIQTGGVLAGKGIDAIFSALKNLGYSEKEIMAVLRESGSSDLTFEVRLKKALSLLAPLR